MAAAWGSYQKPGRGRAVVDWSHALARGLVGCWPMTEGVGPPWNVATGGLALNQSPASSMIWTSPPAGSGRMGPVLQNPLQARNVQVAVPPGSPLDVAGAAISFGGWIYPTISNAFQIVISKDNGTTAATRQYSLFLGSSGPGGLFVSLGGAAGFQGLVAVSPGYVVNAWNLVIATYDGATIRAYINGVQAGTQAMAVPLLSVAGSAVFMGADTPAANNFVLGGYIDACYVWNRALPAADVARLYANPYRLFRPAVDIGWLTSGSGAPPSTASRRTLYDRAGSRGIA